MAGHIAIGIGGWTYEPWRETFYPPEVKAKDELRFASRAVTSIEINGTFYRTQTPASFKRWAEETPDGFVFSVKAHRVTTNRKVLAEAGPSIAHFLAGGLAALGDKLGPVLWQFAPTKKFEAEDCEGFLALLPKELEGRPLRHVLEVRHESFCDAAFITLARRHNVAICLAHSAKYPMIADLTADFVYARLEQSIADETAGYAKKDLDLWAKRATHWRDGGDVEELPHYGKAKPPQRAHRDCFLYVIAGAKERNPAAAQALIVRTAAKAAK